MLILEKINLSGIGMTSQRTRERMTRRLEEQGICDEQVLEVIRTIPRHIFLDEALAHRAYEDSSLPIGHNQTLSQPYIVAKMTELLLANGPLKKVLEIGGGSGYQTAILAPLVGTVHSIERIKPLQDKARERIKLLRLNNVHFHHVDGLGGLPSRAPFDGILSAAAPAQIPVELLNQLAIGGRLVIPVGGATQQLKLVVRTAEGFESKTVEAVKFVPMRSGLIR